MPTTTNNNLTTLIHSLSKSEKRYFKMNVKNNSQLTELFDLLKNKKDCNEDDLLQTLLPDQKPGNIAVIKNRLYNHILKSLNQYHTEKSIEKQIKDKIQSIEILFNKGLFDHCVKIIKSSKKVAIANELHYVLIEINKWERKIAVKYNYENVSVKDIDDLYKSDQDAMKKLTSYQIIWDVKSKMLSRLYSKGKSRSLDDVKCFDDIIKELPSKLNLSLDLESEYLYNHTMSAYYFCILDHKKSYELMKANLELVNANKKFFDKEPYILLSILTNSIYLSKKNNRDAETQAYLEQLEELYSSQYEGDELKLRVFTDKSLTNLASLAMSGKYNEGIALIPEIEEGLKTFQDQINSTKLAGMYYSLAIINFGVGDFSKALYWINKILNEVKINEAEDQYCYAQIMHMIIHVELSNDDYISHSLKSLKRYLKTRNRLHEFEQSFIGLISNLMKNKRESDRIKLYAAFAADMKLLKVNPFTQSAFDYFDFEGWALEKANPNRFNSFLKEG